MSAGRHAVRQRYSCDAWLPFVVVGCLVAVIAIMWFPTCSWAVNAIQVVGIVVAVVGVARHHPIYAYAWWLILAGGGGWILADAGIHLGRGANGLPPSWATAVLMISYSTVAVGLSLLTRRPGGRLETSLDTVIIGAAVIVVVWTFAIRPALSVHWPLPLSTIVALGHACAAAVLVVAVVKLAALDNNPGPASALLSVSTLALALADVSVAAPVVEVAAPGVAGEFTRCLWPVILAAATLHPGAMTIQTSPRTPGPAVSRQRFAVFVFLALVIPVIPLGVSLSVSGKGIMEDVVVYGPPTLACIAVSALLAMRLGLIARVAEGQAQDLRRSLRQRSELERELRHRATHDPLTGLANRAVLLDRLNRTLASSRVQGTLVIIDLDGFKNINDTLGHAVGDEVLLQVANRLLSVVEEAGLVVRLGGDEFAILCSPGIDGKIQARQALDALRPAYTAGAGEVYLSGTAGLLDLAESMTSTEALRDADLALTAAKEIGKNQIVTFYAELREERVRRGEVAAGLRKALEQGGLSVHYQPVVDLSDGRMAAVEALVRWTDKSGKMIPPIRFISVAEETGLIIPIGKHVLRQACQDAREWHERYGIAVTVNVSGHQLREPDFVDDVLLVLEQTQLPARALVLELTETTMITDVEATRALERLRTCGVRVAIDDFGTGYSSLSYLVRLPVDILKIDRAFTSPPVHPAPHHWVFVKAILDLAKSLKLVTIAEGVETDQQAHTLRNLDCPLAQGFLYSRPVPSVAISELLSAWNPRSGEDRLIDHKNYEDVGFNLKTAQTEILTILQ